MTIFTGGTHHEWGFVGGPVVHPSNSKMAAAAISNFGKKISITPDWIKVSAPNFMGRRTKAMQR